MCVPLKPVGMCTHYAQMVVQVHVQAINVLKFRWCWEINSAEIWLHIVAKGLLCAFCIMNLNQNLLVI